MNQEYNIEELEAFLQKVDIPKIKASPKTFLGIAKQPHYENVLSNIYAFYFNPGEEHGLGDLFIKSFVEVINIKLKKVHKTEFSFENDFDIDTEYPTIKDKETGKKGRIDLLLMGYDKAIIIENKVYHILNNNLKNYWETIKVSNKIGILLSLKPMSAKNKDFINITHLEFLNQVMMNLEGYIHNANDKYLVFLKDLNQNIINLSKPMETKDLQFYYKHLEKLNNIASLKFAVRDFIKKEVDNAINRLELHSELKLVTPRMSSNERRLRYYKSVKNEELMFTIIFDGLLSSKRTLLFIVELNGSALTDKEEYRKKIQFDDNENLNEKFYESKGNWAHFALKESDKLTDNDIENLSEYIANKLKESSLVSIFEKLDAFLTDRKQKKQK